MNDAAILLVDDEQTIIELLQIVLQKEGFSNIDSAATGEEAIAACQLKKYDLIVLDVMLPGRSGIDICPFIRQTTNAPILFLSARVSDFDKLTGFAVGGDDYITKPFNPLEIVARIRSQLRRYLSANVLTDSLGERGDHLGSQPVIYDFGRFQVNETSGELWVDNENIACPALVFQLLVFLCKNPNRLFSKSELYESVWGDEALSDDNTIMVHIHRIRERIELDPSNPRFIVNARGLGYKLVQDRQRDSVHS